MIACDGHDGALSAAPKSRHHFQTPIRKYHKYQIDNELRGMSHNHPTGDPTPSRDDITLTREIKKALEVVGIKLHDHLIIGKEGHASLRSLRVIEGWH